MPTKPLTIEEIREALLRNAPNSPDIRERIFNKTLLVDQVLNMCFYLGQQLQGVRKDVRESTISRIADKRDHLVKQGLPTNLSLMFDALIAGWATFDPAAQHRLDFIVPFDQIEAGYRITGPTDKTTLN